MPDLIKKKEELTEKRDQLAARLNAINLDFRQGLDRDMQEQAQQLENQEVLAEIARVTAEELNKVEAALGRIETALRG
jgi:RNA polymerase-binding transcription factor DksA